MGGEAVTGKNFPQTMKDGQLLKELHRQEKWLCEKRDSLFSKLLKADENTWKRPGEVAQAEMASEAEHRPLGVFECQLCALTAPYSYVGQKPPNTQSIILLEESYVMKDPFTSDKDRFLILGSRCSVCSRLVCVGPECSLFYSKRFCLPCVQENIAAFPQEIRQDLQKRKVPPKRPAAQPTPKA